MTTITKPAGVMLQFLSLFFFVGWIFPASTGHYITAVVVFAIGVWLLKLGRRPAVDRRP